MKKLGADRIASMVVYLMSDASRNVSGQIFGVRANEIYLFSQSRIVRSAHCGGGWTPEGIAAVAIPALAPDFTPLAMYSEVVILDPD